MANQIDLQRLRATLRLVFSGEQADALASRLTPGEHDAARALAPVVQPARLSYATARWFSPLRRRANPSATPIHPRLGLGATPALMLALHLGLDLDVDVLARLFGQDASDVGGLLERARSAVDRTHVAPHPDFINGIGRYRDPSSDRLEHFNLLQHLESCGRCQLALEHARSTDEEILDAVDQAERELPDVAPATTGGRAVWLGPALLWGGIAVLVLLLVAAGVVGFRRFLAGNRTPVPLMAPSNSTVQTNGWLLEWSNRGNVEAINLQNGIHHLLIHAESSSTSMVALSPNQQHIAEMFDNASQIASALRVYSLDGAKQQEWTGLETSGEYDMDGWLDNSNVLVSFYPSRQSNEDINAYHARLLKEATLVTFNVDSGQKHVLLQERADVAYAAPDGRHVAVERIADDGTITLELRPVDGDHLGDPVASVEHAAMGRTGSPILWTPDSQRVIFWARSNPAPVTNETPINVMTLDGKVTPIYQAPANAFGSLLRVSPDGQRIIYAEGVTGTTSAPWSYWSISLNGGTPVKLMDGGDIANVDAGRTWSDVVYIGDGADAHLALTSLQPFYLPNPQPGSIQNGVTSYVRLMVDAKGQPLAPLLDQFTPDNLLAWLPESALAPTSAQAAGNGGAFRLEQQPLELTSPLTADSQVSPDGSKVLVYDSQKQFSMAISLDDPASTPQLAGAPNDPSWLPDSSAVIGVQHHGGGGGTTSRIAIYGDIGFGNQALTDFDPAQLGDSTSASYRYPMLSPNGLRYSFFVVDGNSVALWAGSYGVPARAISRWNLADHPNVDLNLVATWAGNDTLLFTEPNDWVKGFPRQVTLMRVTVGDDGLTGLGPLLKWKARGGEKGVLVRDLRLSPDGSQLAIRLRRLTGTNLTTDRFDSISIASSRDVNDQVEVARGLAGEGMSWSPDGSQIAAFADSQLEIASAAGKRVQTLDTGNVSYAYPIWVHPNEIWLQAIASGGKTLNVTVRATR